MTVRAGTPLLILGMIVASCSSAPEPSAATVVAIPGARVDLLTNQNESAADALSTFLLHYDPDGNCLFHLEEANNGEPGTGGRVVIIWPDGYLALSRGDSVTVFNDKGQAVARTGVPFQLSGGGGPATTNHCGATGEWVASGVPAPILDGS